MVVPCHFHIITSLGVDIKLCYCLDVDLSMQGQYVLKMVLMLFV